MKSLLNHLLVIVAAVLLGACQTQPTHPSEAMGILYFRTIDSDTGEPVDCGRWSYPEKAPDYGVPTASGARIISHIDEDDRHYVCFVGSGPIAIRVGARGYEDQVIVIPTVQFASQSTSMENFMTIIKMKKTQPKK